MALTIAWFVLLAVGSATTRETPSRAISRWLGIRTGSIEGKAQIQKTTGVAMDPIDRPGQDIQPRREAFTSRVAR